MQPTLQRRKPKKQATPGTTQRITQKCRKHNLVIVREEVSSETNNEAKT